MTEREINKAIYAKLVDIANDVVKNYATIPSPGTYTLNEMVDNHPKGWRNKTIWDLNEKGRCKDYTIEVGNFKCQFHAGNIFNLVSNFHKIARGPLPTFTVIPKGECVCEFFMDIPKEAKFLQNFYAKKDYLNPVLSIVYIDIENRCLVATDGFALKTVDVNIGGLCKNEESFMPYMKPEYLKLLAGKRCCVRILKTKEYYNELPHFHSEIEDVENNVYISDIDRSVQNYVDYKSVYGNIAENFIFSVRPESVKGFTKAIKPLGKIVYVSGCKGGRTLTIGDMKGNSFSIDLMDCCMADFKLYYFKKKLVNCVSSGWYGLLSIEECSGGHILRFGTSNSQVTFLLNCTPEDDDSYCDEPIYATESDEETATDIVEEKPCTDIVPASLYQELEDVMACISVFTFAASFLHVMIRYVSILREMTDMGIDVGVPINVPQETDKAVTTEENIIIVSVSMFPDTGILCQRGHKCSSTVVGNATLIFVGVIGNKIAAPTFIKICIPTPPCIVVVAHGLSPPRKMVKCG